MEDQVREGPIIVDIQPAARLDTIVLYCNVLYCTISYCVVLYCIVLTLYGREDRGLLYLLYLLSRFALLVALRGLHESSALSGHY